MQFSLNFDLPEKEFREQIEEALQTARSTETVLPLPCHIPGTQLEIEALILSQIDCKNCEALCCRSLKYAEFGIPFLSAEYQALVDRVGIERLSKIDIKTVGACKYMPTPCPFLEKGRCSIYDIRPMACIKYPLGPSGLNEDKTVGLDPLCPEARRITKRVYSAFQPLYNKTRQMQASRDELAEAIRREQMMRINKSQGQGW
jgi:Fe-S-cluster containining protein